MNTPNLVAQTLQQRILSGAYAPGGALPGQRELAIQLGVSRGALREAVSVLTALGLLRSVPGKGMFVAPHEGHARTHPLASRGAGQTMQLRYIVEPSSAALAARTAGTGIAAGLRDLQRHFQRALLDNDLVAAASSDLAFHQAIAAGSGNDIIVAISRSFEDRIGHSQRYPLANTPRLIEAFDEHEDIVAAIVDGDPAAACAAMQRHLRRAAERAGVAFTIP
ncbi:FadR/GntR family transcriptional regulator [Paraburkholderia caballeronis]|uniref:Transcriptional regulator, GntR family n=1 Tax=Paraburkholderia caballeronis TaxID=416943 RepID=A0A1H7RK06_9BURK|nr:FadR/GntR family transcriptional regulator [Paraburkholderia caballeronis]PXW23074.1 GntR family transcriptional regulator [Paraburkholderia caballeronis]PXW97738.1 GntR family transcriptional regulator [Paraburkholderia caballeronis]RAJ94708.1 GntR family transcriptional regulator [Paraburkholderia caballeronis]SEE82820.1 transcriptional regulator, GntR family [Paraburkholderia caballeronis]SEL60533.1 transcriptional regulator, GntR family [Paraburkholderia caballeronis]